MAGLSGSEREMLERAIASLTLAVRQEEEGGGHPDPQVLQHYCRGLSLLLPLLASPSCSGRYRLILRRKCGDFLAKVRRLQRCLRPLTPDPNPGSDPSVPHDVGECDVVSACSDVVAAGSDDVTVKGRKRDGVVTQGTGLRSADPSAAARHFDACVSSPANVGDEQGKEETGSGSGAVDPPPHETCLKKKRERTGDIDCEVATVGLDCSDDSEEKEVEEEEEEEKKKKEEEKEEEKAEEKEKGEEEKKKKKEVEAVRSAVLQAEEVMSLARQFFSEEELEGREKVQEEEEDEASRQQRLVQELLDTVFHSQKDDGDHCNPWVKASAVGLDELQRALHERLVLPLHFPRLLAHGVRFSPYLMLYGRPGDGLLPVLKHLSTAWPICLFPVSARWLLDAVTSGAVSERDIVQALFARALGSAPCALCVTDFEVVGHLSQHAGSGHEETARRLKTELLVHMEQLRRHQDVVVFVAVTSRPWLIDAPVRRKMENRCYCPPPSPQERVAVFLESVKHVGLCLSEGDVLRIADKTSLFSRTDMHVLGEESQAMLRLRVQEARFFKPVSPSARCFSGLWRERISADPTPGPQREIETGASGGGGDPQRRKLSSCEEAEETTQGTENRGHEEDRSVRQPFRFVQRASKTSESAENVTHECHASSSSTTKTSATCDSAEEQCGFRNSQQNRADGDRETGGSMTPHSEKDIVSDDETGACCAPQSRCSSAEDEVGTDDDPTEADTPPETATLYTPCQSGDAGSVPMTWLGVQARSLQEPDLTYSDVLRAIRHMNVEVNEDDVRRLRAWHDDFGSL